MAIKVRKTETCWKARATCVYCGDWREYSADTEQDALDGLNESISNPRNIFEPRPRVVIYDDKENKYFCSTKCYRLQYINIEAISILPTGTKLTLMSTFPVNGWDYNRYLTEVITLDDQVAIRKMKTSNTFHIFDLNDLKDDGVDILIRLQELVDERENQKSKERTN